MPGPKGKYTENANEWHHKRTEQVRLILTFTQLT